MPESVDHLQNGESNIVLVADQSKIALCQLMGFVADYLFRVL